MTFEEACGIKPKEHDPVNHPSHYTKNAIVIEPIVVLKHLPFSLGNCLKYVFRAKDKGNELEDLKKARFYFDIAEDQKEWCALEDFAFILSCAKNQMIEELGNDLLDCGSCDAFADFGNKISSRIKTLEMVKK